MLDEVELNTYDKTSVTLQACRDNSYLLKKGSVRTWASRMSVWQSNAPPIPATLHDDLREDPSPNITLANMVPDLRPWFLVSPLITFNAPFPAYSQAVDALRLSVAQEWRPDDDEVAYVSALIFEDQLFHIDLIR